MKKPKLWQTREAKSFRAIR
ncbi:hypothetical protein GQ600_8801 [Phytophthora cactorum]|nr:hypothetical protein GQ600_8801 [Phytophthora cactorum]